MALFWYNKKSFSGHFLFIWRLAFEYSYKPICESTLSVFVVRLCPKIECSWIRMSTLLVPRVRILHFGTHTVVRFGHHLWLRSKKVRKHSGKEGRRPSLPLPRYHHFPGVESFWIVGARVYSAIGYDRRTFTPEIFALKILCTILNFDRNWAAERISLAQIKHVV